MFELNIGTTPNALKPTDLRDLADQTDGYSGSDIAVIVRDALMQPVRKVLSATHFKPVTADGPDGPVTKLTPCSPGAQGAVEKAWTDVNSEELLEPLLSLNDFVKSIQTNRPTVSPSDIQKYIDFTNESGGEGA